MNHKTIGMLYLLVGLLVSLTICALLIANTRIALPQSATPGHLASPLESALIAEPDFRRTIKSAAQPAVTATPTPSAPKIIPTKAEPGYLKGVVRYAELNGPVTRKLVTSSTGFYGATNLPPGDYTLRIARNGKELASSTATVNAGVVTTTDFDHLSAN